MKLIIAALIAVFSFTSFANSSQSIDLGLYLPENQSSCAYQVIDQIDDSVVIILRKNPLVFPKDPCAYGVDYIIKAEILDSKTFVDTRTNSIFRYYSRY